MCSPPIIEQVKKELPVVIFFIELEFQDT